MMKNKTALITGASSGIGKEFAKLHASRGGDLVVVARSKDKLNELKKELENKYRIKVMVIVKDLSLRNSAQEIYDEVKNANIKIDYLINNAGFGGRGEFHVRSMEQDIQMIENDHSSVIAGLDKLRGVASGGTNFADAINEATDMFKDNKRKIIILLTDGDQTSGNVNYAVNNAKNNDVQIYTVGLGNDVNVSVLRDKIANATGGKYFHADDADSLYQCFDDLSKNVSNGKEELIYYYTNEYDTVKLVADSGFDCSKNGYSFYNYEYKNNGGNCFGMSVTSILYYLNKLPFDSSKSHKFASKKSEEYNVSINDGFRLGKQLHDISLDYNDFDIECNSSGSYNYKLSDFKRENQEVILMNNWWNNIQTDSIRDILTTFSTWSPGDISTIGNIINVLNERPIQLFYMGFDNGEFKSHAIVAEKLYNSTTQTGVYYLKVYNPNHPDVKDYIKVTEKIYDTKNIDSVLSFDDPTEEYDMKFMATDPTELVDLAF